MKRKIVAILILDMFLLVGIITPVGTGIKIDLSAIKEPDGQKLSFDINTTNLPPSFSWRDINGVDFTTPIKNQAPLMSCETFAFVAAVETMVQYKVGYPFGCDLSEAHLYFFSGGNLEWGSYPENNTHNLQEYGVPDEACWPYPDIKYQFPLNTTCPNWQNRTVKISSWGYLPEDSSAIKTALINYGPVVTYLLLYNDFFSYLGGIYKHTWGQSVGPHVIAIVGYNDDPGYWICKNSWGTDWGDSGWFRIKYGECLIEKYSFYLTEVYGNFPFIIVDDDNKEGPWDGTEEHPYQQIQDGIDNAYEGYTVYVHSGTYYENIIINKTINLDGEDESNTIVDGRGVGDVVFISAENVRISGFTIQNSGNDLFNAGISMRLHPDGNISIQENTIHNNEIGIFFGGPSWNIIKNNIIQNNRDGMYFFVSYNNLIEDNVIQNNHGHGIELDFSQTSMVGNIIIDNDECGIYLRAASNRNFILGKNIIENNDMGIRLDNSNRNIIIGNNFINNRKQVCFYNSFLNHWYRNYWNDWQRLIPKPIMGHIGHLNIPWMDVDWFPSRQPN